MDRVAEPTASDLRAPSMRPLLFVMPLLAAALFWSAPAAAQDKENPILALVKSELKDAAKPFTMVVTLKVKAGAGPKLEAAFAKAVAATRKEKGNLAYELSRSAKS